MIWLINLLTLKSLRTAWRKRRYEELKALIVAQHKEGFGGMILPLKFGKKDFASFQRPMYSFARSKVSHRFQRYYNRWRLCIFWRKDLMTAEVGPPDHEALEARKAEQAEMVKQINEQFAESLKKEPDIHAGVAPRQGQAVKQDFLINEKPPSKMWS